MIGSSLSQSFSYLCEILLETDNGNRASLVNDGNTDESQGQPHTHSLKRFKFLSARMVDATSTSRSLSLTDKKLYWDS